MSGKSTTVYHPVFADVTREVVGGAAREAHKAAGWRLTPIPTDRGNEPAPKAPEGPVETDEG